MAPKIEKSEVEWREQLDGPEFEVCRRKGTERAFSGEYNDCKDSGAYRCKCCGRELFRSTDKFDSGSGWPSFVQPSESDAVAVHEDRSHVGRDGPVQAADNGLLLKQGFAALLH